MRHPCARRAVAAALVVSLLAGCEFGERAIAPGRERPVVHAVLNPARFDQYLLLEHTLTGVVPTTEATFDIDDPVVSPSTTWKSGVSMCSV